jgi:hypothetical protein
MREKKKKSVSIQFMEIAMLISEVWFKVGECRPIGTGGLEPADV